MTKNDSTLTKSKSNKRGRPKALETREITLANGLPETGFLRLDHVLAVIPVSKSTLLKAIQDGLFPTPVKLGRSSLWRVSDIRCFVETGAYQPEDTTTSVQPILPPSE